MKGLFEKQITAVIKEPGQKPRVEYLFNNTLESFQKTIGGRIETVTVFSDITFICHAEGRIIGLPFNFELCNFDFYGPVVIVGIKEDEFVSVNMRQLDDLFLCLGL